ncbi:hypothetical protein [Streptomyces sp. NPDC020141]|uniref:hypothetical protein n=1 Tax=Streptomyces sp. NPDC020141 TaxID=3365065 RepID=UPI0037891465
MGLNARAAPGVEARAELAVESACHLADAVTPTAWSRSAAEDALDAIDVLAAALSRIGPETGEALAAVAAATADARRRLGLPADPEPEPEVEEPAVLGPRTEPQTGSGAPSRTRTGPRRRGLGPGFRGIGAER